MPSLLKISSPKSRRARFKISILPVNHGRMVPTVLSGDQCRSIDEHPFLCMLFGLEPESDVWCMDTAERSNPEKVMLTPEEDESSRDKVDRMVYYRIWANCDDDYT